VELDRDRSCARLERFELIRRGRRVLDDCYTRQPWIDFLEKLEPLARQVGLVKIEGNVLRWTTPGVASGGVIRNEQTVTGNKMSGFSEGTTRSEVVLQKK
jgi:hypothetical protein